MNPEGRWIEVVATRDNVHASDESEPFSFEIASDASPEDVLRRAADRTWLPSIQGDRATWSISSNHPLAVVAYHWPDLRFLPSLKESMRTADRRDNALRLHFKYHAQQDPDIVYRDILRQSAAPLWKTPPADVVPPDRGRNNPPAASRLPSRTPVEERHEYDYQKNWSTIALRSILFSLAAVFLAFEALHEQGGLVINGLITLSAELATWYRWLLTSCSAAAALIALFQGFRRLTAAPSRLVLTRSAVTIPTWRGAQSIRYDAIKKLNVLRVNWTTLVLIRHTGGRARIFRALLPSKAIFDQICLWLQTQMTTPGVATAFPGTAGAALRVAEATPRRRSFAIYVPLLTALLEIPWLLFLILGVLFVIGDAPFTNTPEKDRAFQILAMLPPAAALLYGLVCGLLGAASGMLQRLTLAVGFLACGAWCLVLFMPELVLRMIR